jgi:hypothetical protein
MPLDPGVTQLILGIAGPSGVLALVAKLMLNGSKQRLINVDHKLDSLSENVVDTKKAVTRLHVRVDALELEQAHEQGRQKGLAEALRAREVERESSHP